MSMENLARVHKHELEPEEPVAPALPESAHLKYVTQGGEASITHPEVANDNETIQPIATIYPEAANDNAPVMSAEDSAALKAVHERLGMSATKEEAASEVMNLEESLPEQVVEAPQIRNFETVTETVERERGSAEAAPGSSGPEAAQAAGGARKEEGGEGTGSGNGGNLRAAEGGGGTTKKEGKGKSGWLGKIFKFPLTILKWAVLIPTLAILTTLRTAANAGLKRAGFPEQAKGGGSKPAGGGGH